MTTARLQYSISELLAIVSLTFVGMVLLVPFISAADMPDWALVLAIAGTWLGALVGLHLTRSSGPRPLAGKFAVLGCIVIGWEAAAAVPIVIGFLPSLAGVLISIIAILWPVIPGAVIGFLRAWCLKLDAAAKRRCIVLSVVASCIFCLAVNAAVFNKLLHPRPRCCSTQTAAAASCKAYAEAQEIYHRTDYDGDGILE